MYNQTREPDNAYFKKQTVDKLFVENSFFAAVLSELHYKSDQEYRLIFADPDQHPLFNQKAGKFVTFGGFMSPKETSVQFDLSRLKTESQKKAYTELFTALSGHPVIIVLVRLQTDKQKRNFYGNPKATVLQESFHAFQYELAVRNSTLDQYENPQQYPSHEVEGDLSNIVGNSFNDPTFAAKKGFLKIKNMDLLVDYFFKLKSGYTATDDETNTFNVVLNEIWSRLLKLNYKAEFDEKKIESIHVELKDMQSLSWIMKNYDLKKPVLTK